MIQVSVDRQTHGLMSTEYKKTCIHSFPSTPLPFIQTIISTYRTKLALNPAYLSILQSQNLYTATHKLCTATSQVRLAPYNLITSYAQASHIIHRHNESRTMRPIHQQLTSTGQSTRKETSNNKEPVCPVYNAEHAFMIRGVVNNSKKRTSFLCMFYL